MIKGLKGTVVEALRVARTTDRTANLCLMKP